MRQGRPFSCRRSARLLRSWFAISILLTPTAFADAVTANPKYETTASQKAPVNLKANLDYIGIAQRVAVQPSGIVRLATTDTLYEIADGKPVVKVVGQPNARLMLSPDGTAYALLRRTSGYGLFSVELHTTDSNPKLELTQFPFGFGALYLGTNGRLIVTSSPLDDWEGIHGRFLYIFWSSQGDRLRDVTLHGPRVGIVDQAGTALLLLGQVDARAFTTQGSELWQYPGNFRKAAIAVDGKVVLLNPAETKSIREVHVLSFGTRAIVRMPSPVHHVAIAADGSAAAVAIDKGRLFFLDPRSGEKIEVPPLSPGESSFITDLRFIDPSTVVVGLIHAKGKAPQLTFSYASVLAIRAGGEVVLRYRFPLKQPPTYAPAVDVTYGVNQFAARTPYNVLLLTLSR